MTRREHVKNGSVRSYAEPAGILRWIFVRGTNAVTCEIRVNGPHSHDVCVLPHWNLSSAIVDRYDRPARAFRRHAEIAQRFREAGWTLIRQRTPASA
jgi:hypothetical protein